MLQIFCSLNKADASSLHRYIRSTDTRALATKISFHWSLVGCRWAAGIFWKSPGDSHSARVGTPDSMLGYVYPHSTSYVWFFRNKFVILFHRPSRKIYNSPDNTGQHQHFIFKHDSHPLSSLSLTFSGSNSWSWLLKSSLQRPKTQFNSETAERGMWSKTEPIRGSSPPRSASITDKYF